MARRWWRCLAALAWAAAPALGSEPEGPPAVPAVSGWSVTLEVLDRQTGAAREVSVEVGRTAEVGELQIEVSAFQPSFGSPTDPSEPGEEDNPAASLIIREGGREVYSGWMLERQPTASPLEHPRYRVVLTGHRRGRNGGRPAPGNRAKASEGFGEGLRTVPLGRVNPPAEPAPQGPRQVVVPGDVKRTWAAVVLQVTDKRSGERRDVTIPIGEAVAVGSLAIEVHDFLPEFTLGGGDISSKSNEPRNPAARVSITEQGRPVYAGWMFSLYPEAHPMRHERYGVILKDFRQR